MLAPERMKKVTIIGPNSVMDRAISELHRLKAMHISDHHKSEFDIGRPFDRADKISEMLTTVRAISSALKISGESKLSNGFRAVGVKNIAGLGKAVRELNEKVSGILASTKDAEEELKRLAVLEAQLSLAKKLGISPANISDYRSIAYFVGTVRDAQRLRKSLLAITDKFELLSVEDKNGFLVALFIDIEKKVEAAEALSSSGFNELSLAEIKGMKGPASAALESVAGKREKLQKRIDANSRELARLGKKLNDFLLLSEQLLSVELEKAEAPLRFGVSRSVFIIQGWVPASNLDSLEKTLAKATGERIYVETETPHHGEAVPVKLDNPKPARPFEFLMNLYALPKYDEIDPTLFMFVTFPLFFGFILGDVGYGLVSFFLLLWLKEKIPGSAKLVNVLIPSVISSIIFGFIFGEIFGFESAFGIEFPRLINRAGSINELIIISVIVGMLHVNFGFVLGFINELRHKGLFKAFTAKLSWIVLEIGVAVLVGSLAGKLALPWYLGAVIIVASVILIYIGEAMKGLIEIPGLLSNLMSYARLAAVGLSSVILAVVVNDLAKQIARGGIFGMVAAVIVLFIGHTINLALGLLGGFLHSLRLHYVEFFTKFFEGGAIQFKPFGAKLNGNR